ncbi:glycoside hydrolase family 2 protein [Chitinophaga filiformis]|uniref:Glycoside hydrolase family 2 n=1 Tax=Chitinophaga filiformis TaxID=104663 RepID=A0ABY4I6S7_CHIFI|nr:sugar-binding domain-containing protein [Chitinophaga filiformis]UPK71796.1 glycoside hydrolase family 2 [Chitinophaga filiformis]
MLKKLYLSTVLFFMLSAFFAFGQDKMSWRMQPVTIHTRWAKDVNPNNPFSEYPRPQMVRSNWCNLNGLWEYTITDLQNAVPSRYEGRILVPYPLESALSGVERSLQPYQNLWYMRTFDKPVLKDGDRVLLHFGAVDWQATIYINDKEVGSHTGGYQAFTLDITEQLRRGKNRLVVKVFDPTDKGIGPHGKQVLKPGNIYYTSSSGIWQTVWMETVPADYITGFMMTPDIDKGTLNVKVNAPADASIELVASETGREVGKIGGKAGALLELPVKNMKVWSPETPFLYDLTIKLIKGDKIIDTVRTYFGMRKIAIQKDERGVDRIFLNNKPYFNFGTLDQGFWPDGLYTAPTDSALKFDIEIIKAMGFNTIRKHIKIEPARWYYYTDKLGMLVWQDLVNPNQRLRDGAKEQYEKESKETLEQLHNNPSITTWVIFNEKWGAYDQQRITEWVKTIDSSRIVNGHSGEMLYVNNELRSPSQNPWVSSDMTDVHSYPFPRNAPKLLGKARVLGEFGGIGVPVIGHLWDDLVTGWGYDGIVSPTTMQRQYKKMIDSIKVLEGLGLSGSIYTQPFDVEGEQNGLITYDRNVSKVPLSVIRSINSIVTNNVLSEAKLEQLFSIRNAAEQDSIYEEEMRKFKVGSKDSLLLRRISIFARAKNDAKTADVASNQYIESLVDPFQWHNLKFIVSFTDESKDVGFNFLLRNYQLIDSILGENIGENALLTICYNEELKPLEMSEKPNWDSSEKRILSKYGIVGHIFYLNRKAMLAVDRDIRTFVSAKNTLHERYPGSISPVDMNNDAWTVFEKSDDKGLLSTALGWVKKAISMEEENAAYIDTYANLLYKLGSKKEAISNQEKAVRLAPKEKSYLTTLSKMKEGGQTW